MIFAKEKYPCWSPLGVAPIYGGCWEKNHQPTHIQLQEPALLQVFVWAITDAILQLLNFSVNRQSGEGHIKKVKKSTKCA